MIEYNTILSDDWVFGIMILIIPVAWIWDRISGEGSSKKS
jgi:hypothetical protein